MKVTKAIVAASIVLASAQAMAFTPPYHTNGTTYVGTATFKSSGGCKVPAKKFENAQYGMIQDSTNAAVGEGVIDASGNNLLAIHNPSIPYSYSNIFQDTNGPVVKVKYGMISFVGPYTLEYLANQSGCIPAFAWAVPGSTFEINQDVPKQRADFILKQKFVGYTSYSPECVVKDTKTTCNAKKFTGGITFKATVAIP